MGCLYSLVKLLLFIFNIVVSVVGLLFVAFGVYVYVNSRDLISIDLAQYHEVLEDIQSALDELQTILNDIIYYIAIAIIVFGVIVFLIAFCGGCGAIIESICLLITYMIIVMILTGGTMFVLITLNASSNFIRDSADRFLDTTFNSTNEVFHAIELVFECCGTTNARDSYYDIIPHLPPTCCAEPVNNLCSIDDEFYQTGCKEVFDTFITRVSSVITWPFIAFISCEILVIIAAIFLSCSICVKRREKARYY